MINTVIYSKPHSTSGGGTYYIGGGSKRKTVYGDDIVANSGTFKYLNAEEGYIEKLSGRELKFDNIKIDGLSTDVIFTGKLVADEAEIKKAIIDELTSTNITTEYLTVTKQAHFFELIIDKLKSVGGQIILTPTNCIIDFARAFDANGNEIDIDTLTSQNINNVRYFRVYWRANDPANGHEISNDWVVWDQALCQSFNNVQEGVNRDVSNKYYWRLVERVSENKVYCDINQKVVSNTAVDGSYDDYIEYGFETYNKNNGTLEFVENLNDKLIIDMDQTLIGTNDDITLKAEKSNDDSTTPFHVWTGHKMSSVGLQISTSARREAKEHLISEGADSETAEKIVENINVNIKPEVLCVKIDKTTLGHTTETVAQDINLAVIFEDGAYMIFPSGTAYMTDYDDEEDDIRMYYDISTANNSIYQIIIYRNGHSNFVPCHWIDLSNQYIAASNETPTKPATNSGCDYMLVPEASIPGGGDNLCQLGYRYNEAGKVLDENGNPTDTWSTARASAIILAAYNSPDTGYHDPWIDLDRLVAPSYAQYQYIKDFNLGKYRGTYFDANGGMIAGDVTFSKSVKERLEEELDILQKPTFRLLVDANQIFVRPKDVYYYNTHPLDFTTYDGIMNNKIHIIRTYDNESVMTSSLQMDAYGDYRLLFDVVFHREWTETIQGEEIESSRDYRIFLPLLLDDEVNSGQNASQNTTVEANELFANIDDINSILTTVFNMWINSNYDVSLTDLKYYNIRLRLIHKEVMYKWRYTSGGYGIIWPITPIGIIEEDINKLPTIDSTTVFVIQTGEDGLGIQGNPGDTTKFIFYTGTEVTDISGDQYKGSIPQGWLTYPTNQNMSIGEHIWMSQCIITYDVATDSEVWGNWSIPVRIDSGERNKNYQMYWSYARIKASTSVNSYYGEDSVGPWVDSGWWNYRRRVYLDTIDGQVTATYGKEDLSVLGTEPYDAQAINPYPTDVKYRLYSTPISVNDEHEIVYVYVRYMIHNSETYTDLNGRQQTITKQHWSEMSCAKWSEKGKQGLDGAGIEYIYAINNDKNNPPTLTTPNDWQTNSVYQRDEYVPVELGWSDEPFSLNMNNRYCWYATRTQASANLSQYDNRDELVGTKQEKRMYWQPWSEPHIWREFALDGGKWIFIYRTWPLLSSTDPATPIFANATELANDPYWTDNGNMEYDKSVDALWMSQAFVDSLGGWGGFSTPVRISGKDGKDGEDGTDIEFIYHLSKTNTLSQDILPPNIQQDDWFETEGGPNGWTDNPQGVSENYMYEFISVRRKIEDEYGHRVWGPWSVPVIWSKWGEKGKDGDGMEYIFINSDHKPDNPTPIDYLTNDDYQENDEYAIYLNGWTDEPTDVTEQNPEVWVSVRHRKNGVWGPFSDPVIWARWTAKGMDGSHYEYIYAKAELDNPPTKPATGTTVENVQSPWSRLMLTLTPLEKQNNLLIWMSQCPVNGNGVYGTWSDPITISGQDGKNGEDGSMLEFIYRSVPSTGVDITEDPETHIVTISLNGNYSNPNNINTSENGTTVTDDDFVPTGWTDSPSGVTFEYPYEFVSQRYKRRDNNANYTWSQFSTPAIWSQIGQKGMDGDGMEYIYASTLEDNPTPIDWETNTNYQNNDEYLPYLDNTIWFDEPREVNEVYPYSYVCVRKRKNGVWGRFTDPVIWSAFTERGLDGTSFRSYYIVAFIREVNGNIQITYPENAQQITSTYQYSSHNLNWVPQGWTMSMPKLQSTPENIEGTQSLNASKRIFMTQCTITKGTGGQWLFSNFAEPFAITGSQGLAGVDGTDLEFIYARTVSPTVRPQINFLGNDQDDDFGVDQSTNLVSSSGDTTWSDNPRGINQELKCEWVAQRAKKGGEWGSFTTPVIWCRWGEDGKDGDGIEYVFILAKTSNRIPSINTNSYISRVNEIYDNAQDGYLPQCDNAEEYGFKGTTFRDYTNGGGGENIELWTDEPQEMDNTYRYQYVSSRKKRNGVWGSFSQPLIWSNYALDGKYEETIYCARNIDGVEITYDYENYDPRTGTYTNRYERTVEILYRQNVQNEIEDPNTHVHDDEIFQVEGYIPNGWSRDIVSLNSENIYLFMSKRVRQTDITTGKLVYSRFTEPIMISRYGKNGNDGEDGEGYKLIPQKEVLSITLNGVVAADMDYTVVHYEKDQLTHNLRTVDIYSTIDNFVRPTDPRQYNTDFTVIVYLYTMTGLLCGVLINYKWYSIIFDNRYGDYPNAGYNSQYSWGCWTWTNGTTLHFDSTNYQGREAFLNALADFGLDYWTVAQAMNDSTGGQDNRVYGDYLLGHAEVVLYRVDKDVFSYEQFLVDSPTEWKRGLTELDRRVVRCIAESGVTYKKTDDHIETHMVAVSEEIVDEIHTKLSTEWRDLYESAQYVSETLGGIQQILNENGDIIAYIQNLNERIDTNEQHVQTLSQFYQNYETGLQEKIQTVVAQNATDWGVSVIKNDLQTAGLKLTDGKIEMMAKKIQLTGDNEQGANALEIGTNGLYPRSMITGRYFQTWYSNTSTAKIGSNANGGYINLGGSVDNDFKAFNIEFTNNMVRINANSIWPIYYWNGSSGSEPTFLRRATGTLFIDQNGYLRLKEGWDNLVSNDNTQ